MQLWHFTSDAPRTPARVSPGDRVILTIGTWPIKPGQGVWVEYAIDRPGAESRQERAEAGWRNNEGTNSHWEAELGPFDQGVRVTYGIYGRSAEGDAVGPTTSFTVGPQVITRAPLAPAPAFVSGRVRCSRG